MIERFLDWLTAPLDRIMQPVLAQAHRVFDRMPRPLDPFRSIKMKLSILLAISGGTGIIVFWTGIGWVHWRTAFAAAGVGVVTLQVFAHGMTKPLREMTAAARAMARGDYDTRVRATSRDEVGQLARAFNQMAGDLAEADQQRRELIANVSHELRTPITALQGVLENLVDGVSKPDPETLKTALQQTERLGLLVTELLDLSKVDAGASALNISEVDVAGFLTDAMSSARLTHPNTRFVLGEVDCPHALKADVARLHQVFSNLLENAARHSPQGQPVRVSAKGLGKVTVFEVADRGPGIPPQQRTRVFERFTRGHWGPGDGGTGLGLAIARWVVDMHHGNIAIVDAQDGIGCRIRITLPDQSSSGGNYDEHEHRDHREHHRIQPGRVRQASLGGEG
ncbi:MAG TPA: HAMP domain-containing sensor histidine kinase [Candidatus Limnocylindrales bacterium]